MVLQRVPRILFDTDVLIDAANGVLRKGSLGRRIPTSDWVKALAHVNKNFIQCISSYTVAELLSGIANTDTTYFSQSKVALRKLRSGFGAYVHLPYTKYFTMREVFGLEAPYPPNLEDNFDRILDVVLDAASLNDLTRIRLFDTFLSQRKYQVECSRSQAERIQK